MKSFVSTVLVLFFFASVLHAGRPPAKKGESGAELVYRKAQSIVIPSIVYKDTSLEECITYLRRKSVEADPQKPGGLNFVSTCRGELNPITISAKNISVWDACQKVAAQSGVAVSVSSLRIYFHPRGQRPKPQAGEVFYDPTKESKKPAR